MTLHELINRASADSLDKESVNSLALGLGVSNSELFDQFARTVALDFLNGLIPWESADVAINNLYTFAYHITDEGLSDFAFLVFNAFDDAEYIHQNDSSDTEPSHRTRALLLNFMSGQNV